LLPSLLICFIRADYVSIAAQTDPPVQTDKKIYSVTLTPESFQVLIKWTYTNRTSDTVYQTNWFALLVLEKKVGDEWLVAKRDAILIEDEEKGKRQRINKERSVRINPGETLWGTWDIRPVKGSYLGLGSNEWDISPTKGSYLGLGSKEKMRIELKEVPGVYRIFIGLSRREDGGDISGEWLPLEECVSNEFEIVEKE
jgi:hypothetical protein